MPKLLLEDVCGEFVIDRAAVVAESTPNGQTYKRYPGRFSVCDTLNGNHRKYPRRVWEANLKEGSSLQEAIKRNGVFGLLEHPDDGKIDLRRVHEHGCVKIGKAELKENGEVVGEIVVLDTPAGKTLQALIDVGYNPFVSSRGFGSLVKDSEGYDIVQDDFICEGWDVVLKPSFANAEVFVHPPHANKDGEQSFAESRKDGKLSKVDECQPSTTGAASADASTSKPKTITSMDIKQLRESVNALKAVDVKTLTPQRFAEGLSQIEALNREAAKIGATNAEFAWDAKKAHDDLATIEKSWTESAQAPQKAAVKLKEDNTKLLKVGATIAATAQLYKSKLGEALKKSESKDNLIEQLTKRGRGWKARCEAIEAKLNEMTEAFEIAAEGCDALAEMYNKHLTQAGAKLIVLEFGVKAKAPEIQKALKEAKHPNHIKAIRETLSPKEEKKDGTAAPAATPADAADAASPAAESKKDGAAAPAAQTPATESQKNSPAAPAAGDAPAPLKEGKETVLPAASRPGVRSINESIAMAKRLSAATAK